ncbi:hypothetical protein WALSEDRAFT_61529 [Wallemia mellicola CBS 633.66]|uniref:Trafficking protein particle complex subunit 11 domain-containing protein n=1 Tax=Wallemia mellicola (strain ATCC MYA-4683 / CBS 633.66) TaxID=671144 RepID=I4Y5W3_WALMC|nr:hypothetical protein WALSEDRAFT_61529 [Wallemia mellicola CBS 633.66]EIM19355.1 hypothetical protein WALSEDRAFT_61529 [Wallemia mellicola CBS 633.66]|eukprot:XP_006960631.1 hypothetical protein WALSEDRAFT_61529 [Wallemia mellicola CBS 633.66]
MDFNNQRCIQINRLGVNGIEDPNCWDPLIDKLKELTYIGFNTNIQMRLQDVEKSENQINLPGWNFCTFFILKESIALSYIGINLYNEALQIYSQLEQLFHHRLVDNSVISQFADFGGLGDSDDSGDLLSTTKKPYRQMMLSNSISIFDFRLYLFACQAKILGDLLGNIEQVATQSLEFINSFGQTIVSHSKDLKMNFLQYWKFTSSMSVIQQCDKWFTEEQKVNDIARARVFSQVKAQLYELAISQLKELGVAFGIIPNKYPFIRHLPNTKRDKRIPQTSNDQLKWALEQPKEFDKLFVQLCSSGARYYREVGKYKEAWSLDLLVAGLNMERKNFESSLRFFQLLNESEARPSGSSTKVYALLGQVISHSNMNVEKDVKWATAAVDLLKTWSKLDENDSEYTKDLLDQTGNWKGFEWLLHELKSYTDTKGEPLSIPLEHIFKVSFMSARPKVHFKDDEDGSALDVSVDNFLPCGITANHVKFTFQSLKDERVIDYSSDNVVLNKGNNLLNTFCLSPANGTFVLAKVVVAFGIVFEEIIPESMRRQRCFLNIPFDVRALDVQLQRPNDVNIDTSGQVKLKIKSERASIDHAKIRLTSPDISFKFDNSKLVDNGSSNIDHDKSITVHNLHSCEWHTIDIPYESSDIYSSLVHIHVDYSTLGKARQFEKIVEYTIELPLSLEVKHTQTSDMIITSADIQANSRSNVRINDIKLQPDNRAEEFDEFVLAASEKSSFGFAISNENENDLSLMVKYSTIENEVYDLVHEMVHSAISSQNLSQHVEWITEYIVGHHSWDHCSGHEYRMVDDKVLEKKVNGLAFMDEERCTLKDAIITTIEKLPSQEVVTQRWSTCTLPIKLPRADVITTACISLTNNEKMLRIGEATSITMKLSTKGEIEGPLRYELETPLDEWLVSGKVRGEYNHIEGLEIKVSLLPIKMGLLNLPEVIIYKDDRRICTFIENKRKVEVIPKISPEQTFTVDLPRRELIDWARERERSGKLLQSSHVRVESTAP